MECAYIGMFLEVVHGLKQSFRVAMLQFVILNSVCELVQVEMSGTKGPITTFIVEPFVSHYDEYYLSIVSDRLGVDISFSECGGIDIEENWDKVQHK